MIDFHSHILPNIDDGSPNMNNTVEMLKEASEAGFTKVISTSHYISEYYEYNVQQRTELLKSTQENCDKNKLNIKLYLGSEIYASTEILNLIDNKKASTANGSAYVLFELPLRAKILYDKNIIYQLIQNGYIPVIAHPERYTYVQENINYAVELKNMGALFQSNYGSFIGMYGSEAQKTAKKLLKNDMISFLGSDAHRVGQIYNKVPGIVKKLGKWISKDKLNELTTLNAEKVLENKFDLC